MKNYRYAINAEGNEILHIYCVRHYLSRTDAKHGVSLHFVPTRMISSEEIESCDSYREEVVSVSACLLEVEMQKILQKPSPSPDPHGTKSGGSASSPVSIFQALHAAGSQYIMHSDLFSRAQYEPRTFIWSSARSPAGAEF